MSLNNRIRNYTSSPIFLLPQAPILFSSFKEHFTNITHIMPPLLPHSYPWRERCLLLRSAQEHHAAKATQAAAELVLHRDIGSKTIQWHWQSHVKCPWNTSYSEMTASLELPSLFCDMGLDTFSHPCHVFPASCPLLRGRSLQAFFAQSFLFSVSVFKEHSSSQCWHSTSVWPKQ